MRIWKKIAVGAGIALGVVVALVLVAPAGAGILAQAEPKFQAGADAKRVNDIHKIADLLEAYQAKTGHLPFDDRLGPGKASAFTVMIGGPKAERKMMGRGNPLGREPPQAGAGDLLRVLRPVLGADLELPVDPQRAENGAPNVYYVRFKPNGQYLAAGFLRAPQPHTTQVAPGVFAYALRSAVGIGGGWLIWDSARPLASVTPSERAAIRANGDAEDRRFGRYMKITTDGGEGTE